jgi:hypothetical protein
MRRVLGKEERTVDYLGTFRGKVWDSAIFLVIFGADSTKSDLFPRAPLARFYSQKNSTCKRMMHEVKQIMSVRYPGLYFRFLEMKNRVDRIKLDKIREKEDPNVRTRKKRYLRRD